MASTPPPALPGFDLTQMHLLDASFLECAITSDATEHASDSPLQFEVTQVLLEPAFDMEQASVTYRLHLTARQLTSDGTPTGAAGSFRLRFVFGVSNMAEYARTSPDREGPFPVRDLMIMLGGVAYSTSRGLILAKTAGTVLNGFALPLRSPQDIFQESVTILAGRHKEPAKPRRAPGRRKPKEQ